MRQLYCFVFVLLLHSAAHCQTFTSYEAQYKDSAESVQLALFLKAAKSHFFSNRPLSYSLAIKANEIALTKATYVFELADTYNMLGLISMYNEKYEEAEKLLEKSLSIATANDIGAIRLKALTNLALNNFYKGEYQKSLQLNFTLLPLLKAGKDQLTTANCLANIASAYNYLNQYEESTLYQLQALKIFEEINYANGIANAYNTLGTNYTHQKNYAKAIVYLQKSAEIKKEKKDKEGLANSYINLATVYHELENYPRSIQNLKNAEAVFKEINSKRGLVKVYTNMGAHYAKVGDYETARRIEEKAIELAKTEKDEYVNAELYKNISQSYAKLNDLTKAYDFSRKALDSKDSLVDLTLQKQIAGMQVRYETAEKEKALKEQQLLVAQKQLSINKRNYVIAGSSGLFILLVIASFLGYRRYKWKQEARLQKAILIQQEAATKAVLEAEEAERQRIAKDLHDGVGQMMSAAKMNLSAYEHSTQFQSIHDKQSFEKIIHLVDESCAEVRAVSHNMMPNALLKNSLAAAVREFISKLDSRQLAVHLYTEGLEERLDFNVETVLYRVIQECVNNVIKHSGASKLDISLIKDKEEITATIEDNGKGFNLDNLHEEGIGLKNIRTRIQYLKGTVDFDSTPGSGTLVAVHVPL